MRLHPCNNYRNLAIALLVSLLFLAPGRLARAHGDVHLQIAAITKSLANLDGKHAKASSQRAALHHQRGELFRADGDWAAALADYELAASLDPNLTVIHLSRGRVLWESSRPTQAIVSLSTFLANEPSHGEAMLLLARSYRSLGESQQAEMWFARALTHLQAPLPDYYLERIDNLQQLHHVAASREALEQAISRLGRLFVLVDALRQLEQGAGNQHAALALYQELIASYPNNFWLQADYADYLQSLARVSDATQARRAILQHLDALSKPKQQSKPLRKLRTRIENQLTK